MAVFTQLNQKEIIHILSSYNIGTLNKFTPISKGVENTNYLIETINTESIIQKYILTIFEKRVNKQELPFYINLMNFLQENDIPAPMVLQNNNNNYTFNYKAKNGIIISFLKGEEAENISEMHCQQLGESLAIIHNQCQKFNKKIPNDFELNSCIKLLQKIKLKPRILDNTTYDIINNSLNDIAQKDFSQLPKGIIHGDLFPDNVFFLDNKISGIIDFYFSCHDYLLYDITICINAWCFDQNIEFIPEFANAIINSYNEIRPLTKNELDVLHSFLLLTAIRFFLTRIEDQINYNPKNLITLKDPNDFLKRIKFFRSCKKII